MSKFAFVLVALLGTAARSAAAGSLRGSRKLDASVGGAPSGLFGCHSPGSTVNLPGPSEFGHGFNIITGKLTDAAVMEGASFTQTATYQHNNVCYRIPDLLANPTTGTLGVAFDASSISTSYMSAKGTSASSFQQSYASNSATSFGLSGGASYEKKVLGKKVGASGSGTLSTAFTETTAYKNAVKNSHSSSTSSSMVSKNVVLYTATPETSPFTEEAVNMWKTLFNMRADNGLWKTYFDEYGTHIPTKFSVGGQLTTQVFGTTSNVFHSSSSTDSSTDSQKVGATGSGGKNGVQGNAKLDIGHSSGDTNTHGTKCRTTRTTNDAEVYCAGAESECPTVTSTVNKDGSTAWSIDSAAYNTWTESVKKNPTLIVQRAMWIDARIEQEFVALGQPADFHGMDTSKYPIMKTKSNPTNNLLAKMQAALSVYLQKKATVQHKGIAEMEARISKEATAAEQAAEAATAAARLAGTCECAHGSGGLSCKESSFLAGNGGFKTDCTKHGTVGACEHQNNAAGHHFCKWKSSSLKC